MRLLLVFLKEPIPGKVKTRLASSIGEEEATRYYKAMVEVLLKQLRGLIDCRIRFCYAPDDAGDAIRFWLLPEMGATSGEKKDIYLAPVYTEEQHNHQEVDFYPQGDGDLGERMSRAFLNGFSDGYTSIAVIGTDCPDCGARWINAAFSRLEASHSRDGMIGPSEDGGYYLLALKKQAPYLFENIPWSEHNVLEKTMCVAHTKGLTLETLPTLRDVDTIAEWNQLIKSPLGAAIKKALKKTI